MLYVGLDDAGQRTFESWGFGQLSSGTWEGHTSWFDEQHSELLREVLPGFASLWKRETWQRPLSETIYWYVAANRIGFGVNVDSALLFTQAAMELLAWTYCVQDRKMVSPEAFKPRGLKAADKLRILVSTLEIPLEIPGEMKALNAKAG